MENYNKALELNGKELKDIPGANKILKDFLKFKCFQDHFSTCSVNSNCKICLKLYLFSKIFSFFEGKNLGNLELEKMTEEDIYNFFFVDDLVRVEKSGDNINIFLD